MKLLRLSLPGIAEWLTALMLAVTLAGCAPKPTEKDEVARVPAPNAPIDAVLLESSGGATTSFSYELHLVPSGQAPGRAPAVTLYGATRNPQAYGVNLRWTSTDRLELQYLEARSTRVDQPTVKVGSREVAVQLRPGTPDLSAPSGGMAYNLKRAP